MHIGGTTVVVVITVVIMTLYGTYWLGRRLGL
ncbi:hypothetical protein EES40_35960 [Streptomyces sp. ADI93-02]|nr:hypothetical protein EES40_35960 [Streptomyces sp. ADI93-02]